MKIAIAGAGMISRHHLLGWQRLAPEVEVAAICDPDRGRAQSRAAEFGIAQVHTDAEAMLAETAIDALDVASPRETHAGWVMAAAARGIPVLCQKPLTPTLAESDALVRAVAGRIRLMVHENWRFRPWYREARRWIEAGAVGEVLLARMSNISSSLLPDEQGVRRGLVRQPFMVGEHRLVIAESLIHQLDVMRWLCGPLRVVAARTHRSLPDIRGETFAAIFMETAAGRPVEVTGTSAAPGYPARAGDRLEIVGSRASLTFADGRLELLGASPRQAAFDVEAGYQQSFDAVIAHFVACLRSGRPFETDAGENLETLRLVEHAYLAAGQHQPPARTAT